MSFLSFFQKEKFLIHKYNIFELNKYRKTKNIMLFNPLPFENISSRYESYKKHLKKNKDVKFFFDSNLEDMFKKFENLYKKHPSETNRNNLLRYLSILTQHTFIGPQYFHLDINNNCNLNCSYCWWFSYERKKPVKKEWTRLRISFSDFKQIIDDLAEIKTESVLFSGTGEPMLHPKINDMIKYASNKGLKIQLFTNGTLFKKASINNVVDSKVDVIFISISASNPKTYSRVHPGQTKHTFYKVEDNIKKIIQYKKKKNLHFPLITLIFVIDKNNYQDIYEMTKFSVSLGVDSIRFQIANNDQARAIEIDKKMKDKVKILFNKSLNYVSDKNTRINQNFIFQLDHTNQDNNWYKNQYFKKGCYIGWFFSRLWGNKDYSFCCERKFIDNYNSIKFKEIWDSKKYQELRVDAKYSGKLNIRLKNNLFLIDPLCDMCGNYELNESIYNYLKDNDLLCYVK